MRDELTNIEDRIKIIGRTTDFHVKEIKDLLAEIKQRLMELPDALLVELTKGQIYINNDDMMHTKGRIKGIIIDVIDKRFPNIYR